MKLGYKTSWALVALLMIVGISANATRSGKSAWAKTADSDSVAEKTAAVSQPVNEGSVVDEVIWVVGDEAILKSDVEVTRLQAEAEGMGYSSSEALTRASMVEREAKLDYERPIIASVINNRLKSNMLLQIDSTILYPMTEGKYDVAKVSNKDLEYDSPYNTYLHSGLPAGPICNPGAACINAVLNPDQGDYLFYHVVDESTGQHGFWRTQEEFDASFENGDMGIPATSGDANEETAE